MKTHKQRPDIDSLLDRTPEATDWLLLIDDELIRMAATPGPRKPLAKIGMKLIEELDAQIGMTRAQLMALRGSRDIPLTLRVLKEGKARIAKVQMELNKTLDLIEQCQPLRSGQKEQTASDKS